MERTALRSAVWNNAIWCDAVCRAHGTPGEFLTGAWVCRAPAPPFYPNIVTLAGKEDTAALGYVQELLDQGLPGGWGVKDSFGSLDLSEYGFERLFEAEWIHKPGGSPPPQVDIPGVHWRRISRAGELQAWERAWLGEGADSPSQGRHRILLPALLGDESVVILGAFRGGQIVAGVIGTVSGDVVGVSNVFVRSEGRLPYLNGCVEQLQKRFPGRGLVGYEGGAALQEIHKVGFQSIGPLRIWVRNL